MLGHVGFYVDDLKKSNELYQPLLKVIGYDIILEIPQCIAYGVNGRPIFEIYTGKPVTSPLHFAFDVASKKLVEEFYNEALSLGATGNGEPGYRTYFPGYYAAFIIDVNGHNLEAVFWDKKTEQ